MNPKPEPSCVGEGEAPPQYFWSLGRKKYVGKFVALHPTIFPKPLEFFVQFNKDHKNTVMSSTEISNLVGKHSRFTYSCRDLNDGATIFYLVK